MTTNTTSYVPELLKLCALQIHPNLRLDYVKDRELRHVEREKERQQMAIEVLWLQRDTHTASNKE